MTVTLALPAVAVLAAEIVTVSCAPAARLNWEGEAVTPAGIPLTVMLACESNPFRPVRLTVTVFDAPSATETLEGDTVSAKSGGGEVPPPGGEFDPPPQLEKLNAARSKPGTMTKKRAKLEYESFFMLAYRALTVT